MITIIPNSDKKTMLTTEQEAVVNCQLKHFKVLSAAGSGKTTVLVNRIHRLCTEGASPESIMAITFTRRAGKELRNRLGREYSKSTIGTFHSSILRTMQKNGMNPNVLTEEEVDRIICNCADKLGYRVGGKFRNGSLTSHKKDISEFRVGTGVETPLCKMFFSYLAINGDIDFDGILVRGHQMVLRGMFDWVEHLFVDEAQDNEPLQWKFVNEIAKKSSVMVVGDVGQSLYEFRGAVPEQFDKQDWPSLEMTESFRFSSSIAKIANRIKATPIKVVSNKKGGIVKVEKQCDIKQHVRGLLRGGASESDIAVLCRYNSQVNHVRTELSSAGIRVVVPSVKLNGPIHNLIMCLASPGSRTAREKVSQWMGPRPRLVQYIVSDMPQDTVSGIIREFIKQKGNRVDDILEYLNVEDHMKSEAREIFYNYAGSTIEEYRSEEAEPEWIAEGEGVTVGTVHWAKGGEWPVVIVPFVDEGKWPRKNKTAEERRVFYVAITRAIDELYILHGDEPSPFVKFF